MNVKEKQEEILLKSELAKALSVMSNDNLRKVKEFIGNLKQPRPSHSG